MKSKRTRTLTREAWSHDHIIWVRHTILFVILGLALLVAYIYFALIPMVKDSMQMVYSISAGDDLPEKANEWQTYKNKEFGIIFNAPKLFSVVAGTSTPSKAGEGKVLGTFIRERESADKSGILKLSTYPGGWDSLDDIEVALIKEDVDRFNARGGEGASLASQIMNRQDDMPKILAVYDPKTQARNFIFMKDTQAFEFSYNSVNYSEAEMQLITRIILSTEFSQ